MASDLEKRVRATLELDSSGFNSQLKGVNAELKNARSEFKLASEGLKTYGNSTEQLKNVQESLGRQLETQSKKIDIYKQALEQSSSKMEANIKVRDKLKTSLDQTQNQMTKMISTQSKELESYRKNEAAIVKLNKAISQAKEKYGENSQEVKQLQQALSKLENQQDKIIKNNSEEIKSYTNLKIKINELEDAYNKKSKAVESNAKAIQTNSTNLNNANSEMEKTKQSLNKVNQDIANNNNSWKKNAEALTITSSKLKTTGSSFNELGNNVLGITAPVTALGGVAVSTGLKFESQMSRVAAISGSTKEELERLKESALQLGSSTTFSATEVAQAMEMLAAKGFDTAKILDALPGVLDSSTASGESLSITADIMSSSLQSFGLEATQASHVSDVLTENAARTSAGMADVGEALSYVGPVAHAAGLSLEETVASIGILSDASITGSQAGTVLRSALTRLADPSKEAATLMQQLGFNAFDTQGKMLPLDQLIGQLQKSLNGLNDEQKQQALSTMFGKEALSGMLVLIEQGPEKLNQMTNSLKNSDGAAAKMASTMKDNAQNSIEEMKGSVETASIKLTEALSPSIIKAAEGVGKLADKFASLSPETQQAIAKAVLGATAFGGFAKVLGGVLNISGSVVGGIGKLAEGLGKLNKGTTETATKTGLVSKVIQTLGKVTGLAGTSATVSGGGFMALAGKLAKFAGPAGIAIAATTGVITTVSKLTKYLKQDAVPQVDVFADHVTTTSNRVVHANGMMTTSQETSTVKISEATKKAVGSYLELDQKATAALMDLYVNSDKFSNEAKTTVINKFNEMSKNSITLSADMKDKMITDFQNLVQNTGLLTEQNKSEVVKKYTEMVNSCGNLTEQQKQDIINKFTETLTQSTGITGKQSTEIQSIYKDMGEKIKTGLDKDCQDQLKIQEDFFNKSSALSLAEEKEILENTQKHWDSKKQTIDEKQKQITKMIETAANEHRQLTEAEAKAIDSIQKDMKTQAITTLSEQKAEAEVILQRMKDNDTRITAEMAGEHIKKLNEQRDKSVKAAEEEYDRRIKEITSMRDDSKVISKDQANTLIAEAKRQRDGTVEEAETMRKNTVNKIMSMTKDMKNNINTETGNMLSIADRFRRSWDNLKFKVHNLLFKTKYETTYKYSDGRGHLQGDAGYNTNWSGNSYYKGGLTTLNERGEELFDLPTGTRIYSYNQSQQLLQETAQATAKEVVTQILSQFENQNQGNIIIPINIAGHKIDEVIVPRVSHQLALNILHQRY